MKGVIISASLAVLLVVGSIAYTRHIGSVSQELGELNDIVISALEQEDYTLAAEGVKKLKDYLDGHRAILEATGNHEELDKLEINISELGEYINGYMRTDALSHCRVLDFMFEHLPKNYELRLENIL